MGHRNWLKINFTILAIIHFAYTTANPGFHWAHSVTMMVHELGHAAFFYFPLPMEVAAGTVFEFGSIIGLIVYFGLRRQFYPMFFMMFFLGLSLSYTSWYVGDIVKREGQAVIDFDGESNSDWEYMLTAIGQLHNYKIVSAGFLIASIWVTTAASIGSLIFAFKKEKGRF